MARKKSKDANEPSLSTNTAASSKSVDGSKSAQNVKRRLSDTPPSPQDQFPKRLKTSLEVQQEPEVTAANATGKRRVPTGDAHPREHAPATKKARTNGGLSSQSTHQIPPSDRRPTDAENSSSSRQTQAHVNPLPIEVQHLRSKYDFASWSIISSTKMEKRTSSVKVHVNKFSFADINAKPGVAILHAKADAANKMIGVVEMVKRDIDKDRGKWWQYSKLEGLMQEYKKKGEEQDAAGGRTLRDWENRKAAGRGIEDAMDTEDSRMDEDQSMADQEEDESFESMDVPNLAENEVDHKVRAVPLMTIYLARVRIPELESIYGEQTNSK